MSNKDFAKNKQYCLIAVSWNKNQITHSRRIKLKNHLNQRTEIKYIHIDVLSAAFLCNENLENNFILNSSSLTGKLKLSN